MPALTGEMESFFTEKTGMVDRKKGETPPDLF